MNAPTSSSSPATTTTLSHPRRLPWRAALVTLLVGVAASGCQELGDLDLAQAEVTQFGSCGALEQHVKAEAIEDLGRVREASARGETWSPFGYTSIGGVTTGDGEDGTATNHQEAGVAEADLLQLDGRHAFALHERRLVIVETLGSGAGADGGVLQVDGARIVADVALDGEPLEMFLAGPERLVVLTRITQADVARLYEAAPQRPERSGGTVVAATVYDVTDRSDPKALRQVAVEGELVASRRVEDQIFLVARAGLGGPQLVAPAPESDTEAWMQASTAQIQTASLDAWLPWAYSTRFDGSASANRIDCASAYSARTASGDDALAIYSFDVADAASEVHTTTFVGDGTLAYASPQSLIVAHTNYADTRYGDGDTESVQATTLHRFEMLPDGGTRYSASGLVHGWVLNAFSISEHEDHIRVATQVNRATTGYKPINVFTLPTTPKPREALLRGPAAPPEDVDESKVYLQVAGELVDIAHGEDLFAVRFAGDIGYVVTWIEVKGDPLFTIDLANPGQPEILGQLNVPGFSTYLHPIENGRLIGVGRDTDDDAVKLSLYDVRELRQPTALHEIPVGGRGADSEAIEEHRAFRYLSGEQLIALPIDATDGSSLDVYRIEGNSLREVGQLTHDGAQMRRTYAVGGHLYVLSERGLTIADTDDLAVRAQLDF